MKYSGDLNNNDKIPYDSKPIIRQAPSAKKYKSERGVRPSKALALIVFILVLFNIVLGGLVIAVIRKTSPGGNTTINIETTGTIDVSAVAAKCKPSAVRIHAGIPLGVLSSSDVDYEMFSKMRSKGSGVILQDNKNAGVCYILTCYHVIRGYDSQVYILLSDSFTPIKASLVSSTGYTSNFDIAVLKIETPLYTQSSACPAEIADSAFVLEGDKCAAYGNPQGTGLSITSGDISKAIDLVTVNSVVNRVMRTSAAINSGNSGGGLFDAQGRLIGIVNAKTNDNPSSGSYIDNIAFAIPSNVAVSIAKNILRNNRPLRADLGMKMGIADVNETYEIIDGRKIPKQTIIVTQTDSGSALKTNDQILNFTYGGNTVVVRNLYSVDDHIFNFNVGETVTFQVLRNGSLVTIEVVISSMLGADTQMWYNS